MVTCPLSFFHHILHYFIHQILPSHSKFTTFPPFEPPFHHLCLCKLEAHMWDEEGTKICFREAVMNHNLPTTCCGHLKTRPRLPGCRAAGCKFLQAESLLFPLCCWVQKKTRMRYTPWNKQQKPLKICLLPQKETIVFQASIFRCYTSFREGVSLK